jgi:hypothetical protein
VLRNCNYDKIRLLHDLSRIAWYIDKHAKKDADEENHPMCKELYQELHKDLEKHIEKLKQAVAGLSKEDKFR